MRCITKIKNNRCYGCGLCSILCPKSIIDMRMNIFGFYKPIVQNKKLCINCNLCYECCPCAYNNVSKSSFQNEPEAYSGWSKNVDIRRDSTSGGILFEISRFLLEKNYNVCGVIYDSDLNIAKNIIVDKIEDLYRLQGSKYIQSFTKDAFTELRKNKKYLVIGTPCQIDSIRRFIKKFNKEKDFVLIDFFCHGVPSYNLWKKYIYEKSKKNKFKIYGINWRNKKLGWHNSFLMTLNFYKEDDKIVTVESSKKKGDLFYRLFLGNYCLNTCCYSKCKYKNLSSAADIRVGDLWGDKFKNNEEGVNGIVTFTETGKNIINNLNSCFINNESLKTILDGQMNKCIKKPYGYTLVKFCLLTRIPLCVISKLSFFINRFMNLPKYFSKMMLAK